MSRLQINLINVFCCLLPVAFLFLPNANIANSDWINHLWLTAYYGESFRHLAEFPHVINTTSLIGIAHPIIYGYLFYPLAGFLSGFFGASFAIRALLIAVRAFAYFLVYVAAKKAARSRKQATIIAILVSFSAYPLTNLFSRVAIPEFFATRCLVSAIASWLIFLWSSDGKKRFFFLSLSGLMLTLAIGSHPITALFGTISFAVVVVGSLPVLVRRGDLTWRRLGLFLLIIALSSVVLFPWAFAIKMLSSKFAISEIDLSYNSYFDSWRSRFSFLPTDLGATANGSNETPFLEAPLNMAFLTYLALLIICVTIRGKWNHRKTQNGWLFCISLVGLAIVIMVSLLPSNLDFYPFSSFLPRLRHGILHYAQFAFRFVTYGNLFLFVSALSFHRWNPSAARVSKESRMAFVAIVPLALAWLALGIKLDHSWKNLNFGDSIVYLANLPVELESTLRDAENDTTNIPPTFYGINDYSVPSAAILIKPDPPATVVSLPVVEFPVNQKEFASVSSINVELAQPQWTVVNIYPFPWNKIHLDGVEIPFEKLALTRSPTTLNFRLVIPSGSAVGRSFLSRVIEIPAGKHTLDYFFDPPSLWQKGRRLSLPVFGFWMASLLGFFIIYVMRKIAFPFTRTRKLAMQ
jgi:hypothetical protein